MIYLNNGFNFNDNKVLTTENQTDVTDNKFINDPFANMNRDKNNDDKKIKKYKIALYVCIFIIIILLLYSLIVSSIKTGSKRTEIESKENLEEISNELKDFISDNHIDAMDLYGDSELLRLAINSICYGVVGCNQVSGDVVNQYVEKVFNETVVLQDVNCENNDGILYKYDLNNNKFIYNNEHPSHNVFSTEPVYVKVNSIKKKNGKYVLVLNKLYYNSGISEFITSDPFGINSIYKFADYDMPGANGDYVIDTTKLISDYENNFDKLKNKGTRYQYTFEKQGKSYVLIKYEVLGNVE